MSHDVGRGRGVYVYLIGGEAVFDDVEVSGGDAAIVREQEKLTISARDDSELILVDVPLRYEPVGVWRRFR